MCAICFGLYLGHREARQYKFLTKEELLLYSHYFYNLKTEYKI